MTHRKRDQKKFEQLHLLALCEDSVLHIALPKAANINFRHIPKLLVELPAMDELVLKPKKKTEQELVMKVNKCEN